MLELKEFKQPVVVGVLEMKEFKRQAVVLSSGWPSISLVLEGMGFLVTTFSSEAGTSALVGKKWNQLDQFDPNIYVSGEIPSIWVQGHLNFVEEKLKALPKQWKEKIGIGSLIGRKYKEWKDTRLAWCTVSHAQMGGITLGRFRVAMPQAVSCGNITRGAMVRRKLKHVLDHTLRGFPQGVIMEENNKKRKREEER